MTMKRWQLTIGSQVGQKKELGAEVSAFSQYLDLKDMNITKRSETDSESTTKSLCVPFFKDEIV